MKPEFKGIFAALTTPFVNGEISPQKFIENIDKYNTHDLAGYVIGGSTGENVYLTDKELHTLIKTAKENAAPDRKVIAGTARESTKNTIEFTNRSADIGIDAALIILPHYYKSLMITDALKQYYLTIADKSQIPIIIYSIPRNTGITPDPQLIIDLSQHPNILGIKDSSGNLTLLEEAYPYMSEGSTFLLGAGSILLPALSLNASGGILTLGAVAPELCVKLYSLFLENRQDEAQKLQLEIVPLNQAITKIYGVPGAKYALDLRGYYGGLCRSPLLPLNESAQADIRNILSKLDLI